VEAFHSQEEGIMTTGYAAVAIRWTARVWSVLSILTVLAFAIGEMAQGNGPRPTHQEWVGLALWPIGVCLGLAVAWLREELGGIVALGCLFAFYVWNLFRSGHLPRGPFFVLIAAPAAFFLIAGVLSRNHAARPT
jgi:hypothetical protein